MGISEEQFWEMNPARLKPYRQAQEIRESKMNHEAWLYGFYVWEALQSALSGIGSKRKAKPYLKEPIPINSSESEKALRKKEERMKQQFATFVEGLKHGRHSQNS